MSVIATLAKFVCTASAGNLPAAEQATQRRHVADAFLAAVAGSLTTEGLALRQVFPETNLADTLALAVATIRHTEIDDIHLPSCTTPSSVTVPTALALARKTGDFDPEQVASAIWVGTELMTRFGMAVGGPTVLYRGIWPTYLAAPLASAAIAARMWRLTEAETVHALSLALMLTAGRSGKFQGRILGRWVILALAVAAGMRAAQSARLSVGGDPDLLDGAWLKDAHGLPADMDALMGRLGETSVYSQLSLKPFCSAKQAIAATEALMTLLDAGLPPEAIAKIRVHVPPAYARMIAMKAEAGNRASTFVSAAFQLALAAYSRERLYDIERSDVVSDALLRFAGKVEIVADNSLLEFYPRSWPAEIAVEANGQTLRKRIVAAHGDPERPIDDAQLTRKAEGVLRLLNGAPKAGDVVGLGLRGLTDEKECKRLAEAMWATCRE